MNKLKQIYKKEFRPLYDIGNLSEAFKVYRNSPGIFDHMRISEALVIMELTKYKRERIDGIIASAKSKLEKYEWEHRN